MRSTLAFRVVAARILPRGGEERAKRDDRRSLRGDGLRAAVRNFNFDRSFHSEGGRLVGPDIDIRGETGEIMGDGVSRDATSTLRQKIANSISWSGG
jgi:hypothetical protein